MKQGIKRILIGIAGAALLALIFYAYLQPGFVLDLANRIYLCF
ncbi:MAG: hypothetical protein ACOH2B_06725 [Burkholderiaceae bacterium]